MEEKKFQSVVRRIVLYPLLGMALITFITIVTSAIGFMNMQNRMVESSVGQLRVSQSQLENLLGQIDRSFVLYQTQNENYQYLKNFDRSTPKEDSVIYEAETLRWMDQQAALYGGVQGYFVYFSNMDQWMFRGTTNYDMHVYIKRTVQEQQNSFNRWQLVTVEGEQYLLNIKKEGVFYGGAWIPVNALMRILGLEDSGYQGRVYLFDYRNESTLDANLRDVSAAERGTAHERLYDGKNVWYNYTVTGESGDVFLGILISRRVLLQGMSLISKIIFLLAALSVLLVPIIVFWLRRRIAIPVRVIDSGMRKIGEGTMDYRIPLPDKKTYDEFDRLMVQFNRMMDKLNELEFDLYKTKIREQQIELKYISQQIRPHFILNALNIIYTYEESDFPLVKKMVLYLTDYFRYIVNLRVDFVAVEQELRHVENYLNIQKERYLDRFDFFVEWEAEVGAMLLPPLIIQTFVENCIKYGNSDGNTFFIYVLATCGEEHLKLMIADTGEGFSEEALKKIRAFVDTREHQDGLGVGIENAIERMDILYGEPVTVHVKNGEFGGAIVEIALPILR